MTQELTVITHVYDLLLWTVDRVEKFPRGHRFRLGGRIEEKLHALLDILIEAKFSRDKTELLRQAGLRVEQLRYLLRAAKDLKLLAYKSHHHACQRLDEIGRQLGGWRKRMDRGQ